MANAPTNPPEQPWYAGVTRYQWLVLAIASAGWIFDTFEGQIFNITRADMLKELLHDQTAAAFWGDVFLGVFLLGGTLGGIMFGSLADRWGRRPTMVVTILMYSIFSGLTYFVDSLWQVGVLRFLVAMGVGGEWAVAAALVAEVFPARARAHASGIFHATSVLGTWLATFAGLWVQAQWRYAFLIGVLPALLVLWVRASVDESEAWREKKANPEESKKMGSLGELLGNARWFSRAVLGMLLAGVGLACFWGVTVAGQDLARVRAYEDLRETMPEAQAQQEASKQAKFAYGYIQTTGAGLGLLAFGPICVRLGRKRTFALMHVGAFASTVLVCLLPTNFDQMKWILPIFGFFTLSMHAGYAIYFPELFPTHLRATGTGVCFNGGRFLAAPMLWLSGWLKSGAGLGLVNAVLLLSGLFLLALFVIAALPETKDKPLPE